jgi:hypothetical protein
MTTIIAGAPEAASTLAEGRQTGTDTAIWSHGPGEGDGSVAALAGALVAFQADAAGQQIDAIVLADDSDAALAAALVGTKLPVDVSAVAAAREASSANGRLIAQLAAAYTPPA